MTQPLDMPPHPFWCDDCGGKASFKIKGFGIAHDPDCPRHGENAEAVFDAAWEFVRVTGKAIP